MAPETSGMLRCWQARADFDPAPGALYELPLQKGDMLALVSVGGQIPDGWLFVNHLSNGLQGLVPLSFVEELEDTVVPPIPSGEAPPEGCETSAASSTAGTGGMPASMQASSPPSPSPDGGNNEFKRQAIHAFKPEAGAVYELPVEKGDLVELAIVDWTLPEGWVVAKNTVSGSLGLVPKGHLAPLPKEANEPTLQELKERAERALRETLVEKEKMAKLLAVQESQLKTERTDNSRLEAEQQQSLGELAAKGKENEGLSTQVRQLNEVKVMQVAFEHVCSQLPKVRELVDSKIEETKRIDEAIEQAESGSSPSVAPAGHAPGEPAADDGDASAAEGGDAQVLLHSEESEQGELLDAERERARIARKIQQLDSERHKAIGQLTEAETRYIKVAKTISAKDEAAASAQRVTRLLPRVKELLAPTQDELTAYLEVMTSAVMRTAEESAVVLLETLARTNDPQQAITQAFQMRAARRASAGAGSIHQHILEHRIGPRPMRRQASLPSLAARPAPSLPEMQPTPARRAPPSVVKRPPRPSSANPLHNRMPPGRMHEIRHRKMPLPDRLRRTLSWEPSARPAPRLGHRSSLRPASSSGTIDESPSLSMDDPKLESLEKRNRHGYNLHVDRLNKARETKARATRAVEDGVFSR